MSSIQKLDLKMTASEYALWEQEQTEKHEYYAGEVFSQAGGTAHAKTGRSMASTRNRGDRGRHPVGEFG